MDIEIPANATATVFIPASTETAITENGKSLSDEKEIVVKGMVGKYIELQTGSGTYHFSTGAAK
jgi:alpha-L-rhamnosidase